MKHGLSPRLRFAICEDRVIFLDLEDARYFCLPADADVAFRSWIRGEHSPEIAARLSALERRGLLTTEATEGANDLDCPLPRAVRDLESVFPPSQTAIVATLTVGYALALAQWVIGRQGFKGVIAHLARPSPSDAATLDNQLLGLVTTFQSRRAVMPLARDCLLDSYALALFLRRFGRAAAFMVGVTDTPFTAHSWLQLGDVVINDKAERVANFVPILSLAP